MILHKYKSILEGPISRAAVDLVIDNAGNDPEKFRILTEFVLNGKEPLPSRAAWALVGIDEKYPELIIPYISPLIKALPDFVHPGTKRNVLKILTRKTIPKKLHGKLADQCFIWLLNRDTPVAIQVYSMQIIANLSGLYPELMLELKEVLESRIQTSLPGFKSRAKKILKK